MTLKRIFALWLLTVTLSACTLPGSDTAEITPGGPTPTSAAASVTPLALAPTLPAGPVGTLAAPTLTASPAGQGGPTALPPPTQIGGATPTVLPGGTPGDSPTSIPAPQIPSGPGISINPQLGEPLEVVLVDGDGFAPGEEVTLHWGPLSGERGPEYWKLDADSNGKFQVGLIVPGADKWPGGNPKEGDELQLRAYAESLDHTYWWANFKYIKRFNPGVTFTQTFENPDWDYSIGLPDGWTWTWTEDKTDNVRFSAGSGSGKGFVRVVQTTDMNAAISSVMSAESLTFATSKQTTLGNFPGTEVTTSSGRVVWFIPAHNRVYALSFVDDAGKFFTSIAATLKIF